MNTTIYHFMLHPLQRIIYFDTIHGLKTTLLFAIFLLSVMPSAGQTVATVTIGATSGPGSFFYGPVYRNTGNAGIINYSRHAYLYTATELGIPAGSKIIKLEWIKKDTGQVTGNNVFNVWLTNTTSSYYAASTAWGTLVSGADSVYNSTTFSVTGPANTYLQAPFADSFDYNGANLQVLVDWRKMGYATAAVNFYATSSPGKALGFVSNAAMPSTTLLQPNTYGNSRPTIRITYVTVPVCTGMPAPGNTLANVSGSCTGTSFNLSLQNNLIGSQITYQWQKASNATFTSGLVNLGIGSTQTTSQTVATYYRCKVTCGASGLFTYSTPLFVPLNPHYQCYCASSPLSDADEDIFKFTLGNMRNCSNCASVAPGLGSVLNMYSNYQSVTPPNVQRGASIPFGVEVGLCGTSVYANRTAIFIDYNQNMSFADAGELVYSSPPNLQGAHAEFGSIVIPATALAGLTGVRVITSEQNIPISDPCLIYPWGETEDYLINIQASSPCVGTPIPGNTIVDLDGFCSPISGSHLVCSGQSVSLGLSNSLLSSGFTYQWYNNLGLIVGATNPIYVSAPIVSNVFFYCKVTCTASGLSATSTPIYIGLSSFENCYCRSAANTNSEQDILSVTFNGNTNISDCNTPALGSGSILNKYANYTSQGSLGNGVIGGSVPFSIYVDDCDIPPVPYYSFGTSIWIDFNHNASFADAGEQVFIEPTPINGPRTVSGSISIPCTALLGQTRMRISVVESLAGSALQPCMPYGFGETEDYIVNLVQSGSACITPIPAPGNAMSNITFFCDSTNAILTLQNTCLNSNYTYQWFKNGIAITGATSLMYSTPKIYATTAYYCRISCGASFVNSGSVTITKSSASVSLSASATSYCTTTGSPVTITATGATMYTYSPTTGLVPATGPIVSASPSSTTTYTVFGTDANGCVRTSTVNIQSVSCAGIFTVKCYIEGYYQGAGFMSPVLLNEGVSAITTLTDSIDIVLRQSISPYGVVATKRAGLSTAGFATANFPTSLSGTYYLSIKHRNAVETWSSIPVMLSTSLYDFTTADTKAFGANQRLVDPGTWALFSGDVNMDDNVDLLDISLTENDITNFAFGYEPTDINGDGNVDLLDTPIIENNVNNFIYSMRP
ncbi:MAG: hypothetical protein IPI46_02250 [Bacteroidetes bacterium]|nr:hypothetical protein [Bacteroidota bacterium]